MKKLLVLALALTLGACANLKTAYQVITEASVSPTQIIVAANAFDALEGTATQYLVYCKANLTTAICSASSKSYPCLTTAEPPQKQSSPLSPNSKSGYL